VISVLGLGNVLMGDDGLGPAVVNAFEAGYSVGPDVQVIDLGTPGLDLLPWLADIDRVILVDTVKSDLPPGTLKMYDKDDLLRHVPLARIGPHDPGVKEALLALEFAGRAPREVVLIGVVPARTGTAVGLSPAVQDAIPHAVAALVSVLAGYGATVVRHSIRREVAPWWTAAPSTVPHYS
jgi:hydrogenase maturation protease